MNKIFFVLAVLALFNAHIARGDKGKGGKSDGVKKNSASSEEKNASPASGAAPEKPETCTASRKGAQETFQTGDRYCASETTHRVCNYGEWIDGECPPNSKCMEGSSGKQVLCREIRKNVPWPTGPSGAENTPSESQSNQQPQAQPSNPKPSAPEAKPSNPQTADSQPAAPQEPKPQPADQETKPLPAAQEQHPIDPKTGAHEPHDCPGGLKDGEQICSGETGYKMCHDGNLIEEPCPSPAKCVAAVTGKTVLCREVRRNTPQEKPQSHRRR